MSRVRLPVGSVSLQESFDEFNVKDNHCKMYWTLWLLLLNSHFDNMRKPFFGESE